MNKFKSKIVVIISAIITIAIIIGCSKKEEVSENNIPQSYNLKSASLGLTDDLISDICELHNSLIYPSYVIMDGDTTDAINAITNIFLSNDSIYFGMDSIESSIFLNSAYSSLDFLENNIQNEDVVLFMRNASELVVDHYDTLSYSHLVSCIDIMIEDAEANFEDFDLEVTKLYLEGVKASGYFWMPSSKGGSGIGDELIRDWSSYYGVPHAKVNWGIILTADVGAMAGTFTGIGLTLLATPATLGALAAVVGWSAAWSSSMTLITQLALEAKE